MPRTETSHGLVARRWCPMLHCRLWRRRLPTPWARPRVNCATCEVRTICRGDIPLFRSARLTLHLGPTRMSDSNDTAAVTEDYSADLAAFHAVVSAMQRLEPAARSRLLTTV